MKGVSDSERLDFRAPFDLVLRKHSTLDPEATAKAFKVGYFASGDLAVKHLDRSVAILGRSKDLLISGSEVS